VMDKLQVMKKKFLYKWTLNNKVFSTYNLKSFFIVLQKFATPRVNRASILVHVD
jgi:hypothetical protein